MLAVFAVACTSSGGKAPTASGSPSAPVSVAPTSAAASQDMSKHVRVLGLWSGPEYNNFVTVKSVWETQTGDTVDWQGTQDLAGALDADDQAGTPPDIAVLPNLALMQQLAAAGKLVPLNSVLDMNQVGKDYATAWTDLGSYNGKSYGIFYKSPTSRPFGTARVPSLQVAIPFPRPGAL